MSKPLYSAAQDYAKVYEQIERNRPFPMIEGLVRAGGWFDVAMLAVSAGVVGIATGFSSKRAQKEAPRVRHMTAALSLSTMDVVAEIGTGSVAEASGVETVDVGEADLEDADDIATLHDAAWQDRAGNAAELLSKGADVNACVDGGTTALHVAAASGAAETMGVLLLCGASAALRDAAGQTPLHVGASAGEDEVCAMLLEADASTIESVDGFGWTALRWAVLNGHASTVAGLVSAAADATRVLDGLSPLALASAAGHADVVEALLLSGVPADDRGVAAAEVAAAMGHAALVELLPDPRSFAGSTRAPAASPPSVAEVDSRVLAVDRTPWDRAFSTSTPLLLRDLARPWSDDISSQSPADLKRRWGDREVTVAFSPDECYQRPSIHANSQRKVLRETPVHKMSFADFVDLLPQHGSLEHFAVTQSPSVALDEFDGLPDVPPVLERLFSGSCKQKNLWVCQPPKVSALHYDTDDSILLQLSGTKRFTLVAPQPLHGLTVYPTVLPIEAFDRREAGDYESVGVLAGRNARNFPLVDPTDPDASEDYPLFRGARTVEVEVPAGSALLLPAYWYHRVESFAPPGRLNVAINYWFDAPSGGAATPARLHRILRSKLYARSELV